MRVLLFLSWLGFNLGLDPTLRSTWNNLRTNYREIPRCDTGNDTDMSDYLCGDDNGTISHSYHLNEVRKCQCDDRCVAYGDCCMDKLHDVDATISYTRGHCRPLPGYEKTFGIYTVDTCDSAWSDDTIKYLCENNLDLDDLLYTVPVHSKSSREFYKNVYCAACNYDNTNLTEWDLVMYDRCVFSPLDHVSYDRAGKWVLRRENQTCRFQIEDFKTWPAFSRLYEPRPCSLKYVSSCEEPDSPSATLCPKYIAPIALLNSYGSIVKEFKNYHCFACNSYNYSKTDYPNILCERNPESPFGSLYSSLDTPRTRSRLPTRPSLSMLLNFNSIELDFPTNCGENQVFMPALRRCVSYQCSSSSFPCVSPENFAIASRDKMDNLTDSLLYSNVMKNISNENCTMLKLLPTEYSIIDNDTVRLYNAKIVRMRDLVVNFDVNNGIFVCDYHLRVGIDHTQEVLTVVCLILSIICLCLHLVVYSLLPKLRNVPGKTLMSISASLAFADTLFLIGTEMKDQEACLSIGILQHYAYLAVFFWTNVKAMDLHRTFAGNAVNRVRNPRKTFLKYAVYAWGVPATIVSATALLDAFLPTYSSFKPNYGMAGRCWISSKLPLLLFFVLPVAVMLVANVVYFLLTAINLYRTVQQTRMARFNDKLRFVLYVKLATVLGLTWAFGFVAALANVEALWYPFIVLSGLQGVYIFVAFTCNKKTLVLLRQKWGRGVGGKCTVDSRTSATMRRGSRDPSTSTSLLSNSNSNSTIRTTAFPSESYLRV